MPMLIPAALGGGALGAGALGAGALGAGALAAPAIAAAPAALAASSGVGSMIGAGAGAGLTGIGGPMAGMTIPSAPAVLGAAATGAGPALMGGLPNAAGAMAGRAGPGGLMGWLQRRGLNEDQAKGLPLAMGIMGQGMTSLGGGQPQQPAPDSGPLNNPAAIQAAVRMMQNLKTRQPGGGQRFGGFPQGPQAQFPGTRDRGVIGRF